MRKIITSILSNILTAIYQPFWFALLAAILLMFLYLFAREHGWKQAVELWLKSFRTDRMFRKVFLLGFYTILVLFRTLLNRNMWANPLSDLMGGWGLYNSNGELTTEAIENFFLLLPWIMLLFWTAGENLLGKRPPWVKVIWTGLKLAFLFSLSIESLQLLLRLGTFQLSDLFYNTLGGGAGSGLFWLLKKFSPNKRDKGR